MIGFGTRHSQHEREFRRTSIRELLRRCDRRPFCVITADFLIMRIIDSIMCARQEEREHPPRGDVGRVQKSNSYRSKMYNPFSRSLLHCFSPFPSLPHRRLPSNRPAQLFFVHVHGARSIFSRSRIHFSPLLSSLSSSLLIPIFGAFSITKSNEYTECTAIGTSNLSYARPAQRASGLLKTRKRWKSVLVESE